jgi:hypothetical protein
MELAKKLSVVRILVKNEAEMLYSESPEIFGFQDTDHRQMMQGINDQTTGYSSDLFKTPLQ